MPPAGQISRERNDELAIKLFYLALRSPLSFCSMVIACRGQSRHARASHRQRNSDCGWQGRQVRVTARVEPVELSSRRGSRRHVRLVRGGCGVVIRTPDQRLRVFVSSTLGELAVERRAVARAITGLRLAPVLFEAGARAHPPRELYQAYLAPSGSACGRGRCNSRGKRRR